MGKTDEKEKENKTPIKCMDDNADTICPYLLRTKDAATKFVSLGWRCGYTIAAWFVLGFNVSAGNSFFVSLVLFMIPLLIDYLKFNPDDKLRKTIRGIGIGFTGLGALFGALGMSGLWKIVLIKGVEYVQISNKFVLFRSSAFDFYIVWGLIGATVLLTGLDWIIYEPKTEKVTCYKFNPTLNA